MSFHLVPRPRLLAMIGGRWGRRAVLIVAGPGFGKSVLLGQAMTENSLAPRGVDVLFRCTGGGGDLGATAVVRGIAEAAGIRAAAARRAISADWLLAELSRRWPLGVCVFLDDVHHLCCTAEGTRLLARLVNDAPSCVHFVLSGRAPVRGLARARVSGEIVEIGEDDLSLTVAETSALAHLHNVDPCVPASVGGWPAAAAMAAAYGICGAEEYVFEAVLDHLDEEERSVLAIAASIGGGDAELLRASIGPTKVDPVALLSRLPLVTLSEHGEYIVHDLWQRVVATSVGPPALKGAVARVVAVLVQRGWFDRAFRLCFAHDDWDGAASVLTACCRQGHVAVLPDVLAGWHGALPAAHRDQPDGLLLRGLMGRVTDPFSEQTADLLERAVAGYRAIGNVAGEIAAGVELVYVLRNQGRCDALPVFLARAVELDAAGHVEVAGPAAVARALLAELSGDDRGLVAELDAVPAGSLSRDWQVVVAFRQAIAHLTLGDEQEMLAAASRCYALAEDANDRHVLALAEWFAGDPVRALETVDEIAADASHSQTGAVLLGTRRRGAR
ncbi:MAG: hypothetical protein ABIR68_08780 [Ilumatobacteraceae bacterium]